MTHSVLEELKEKLEGLKEFVQEDLKGDPVTLRIIPVKSTQENAEKWTKRAVG